MNIKNINKSLLVAIALVGVLAIGSIAFALTGTFGINIENVETFNVNTPEGVEVGEMLGGTRWPNGISADNTSPSAGEVRGTTFTSTGAVTLGGTVAVGGTLNALRTSTTTDGVAITVLASESGKLFLMKGTGATSTLPAVTNTGATFKFSVKAAFGTNFVIESAEGDNINGSLFVNSAVVACSGEDKISFVEDGEAIGDFVELISDGTNWNIVNSRGEAAGKVVCTDDA